MGAETLSGLQPTAGTPFLSFAWLDALERTGCVTEARGWLPMHMTLHRAGSAPASKRTNSVGERVGGDHARGNNGELLAFAPAYVKTNSEGEFVFDHGIARFAQTSLSLPYYPKLILAVPFTPVTGSRLLVAPGQDPSEITAVFAGGVRSFCEQQGLSGAHVLFPPAAEASAWVTSGYARRIGVQYQWHNQGYGSFDEFLGTFNAKRRHQIRRERRQVAEQDVEIEVVTGRDLEPSWADFIFDFYRSTVDKYFWGRRYLNRSFFEEVLTTLRDQVHLVVARDRGSRRRLAGAFNLLGSDALYGRYWGAIEDRNCLHFEVCFYSGVEDAIARGLKRFEPGAGGEHKLARGFVPTRTFSTHHYVDPRLELAVRDFLAREESAIEAELESVE
ncbi:MAG TPA: GNAT family N-acetyltransferase [Polyangiaceae bacterium]|nr:GNAT family N-acetyltransferase [Polyangiaceae bacterium]